MPSEGAFLKWESLTVPACALKKYAPLRDPIELIVKGYHVSLRVEEAAMINVEDVT